MKNDVVKITMGMDLVVHLETIALGQISQTQQCIGQQHYNVMNNFKELRADFKSKSMTINMNILEKHLGMCNFKCDAIEKEMQNTMRKHVSVVAMPDRIVGTAVSLILDTQRYNNKHWQRTSIPISLQTKHT